MSALDAVLEELAERVAAKVLARLSAPSSHYTTRAAGPHPPGKSRAWALRKLKTVPGAQKVGRDWVVSVGAYEAWISERDRARLEGKSLVDPRQTPANDVDALADAALREAGFRRTRSSAR